MNAAAILLDIEGTTTPIDFVHKTLFHYAKERMGDYVRNAFAEIGEQIDDLKSEREGDSSYPEAFDPASPALVSAYLEYLIDQDRKSTPLKSIQGRIWEKGYESGELKSTVFDDVSEAFERWHKAGKTIAIYSSGSVLAQQLLFRHTDRGDLTKFISNYFDTNTGAKRDVKSYADIAAELKLDAKDILFISDILAELDAARTAGYQTALSVREGNAEIDEDFTHQVVTSFDGLA